MQKNYLQSSMHKNRSSIQVVKSVINFSFVKKKDLTYYRSPEKIRAFLYNSKFVNLLSKAEICIRVNNIHLKK